MASVLLKVIRHLVRAEGILCCEGKRAKKMCKFLKKEKKKMMVNVAPQLQHCGEGQEGGMCVSRQKNPV